MDAIFIGTKFLLRFSTMLRNELFPFCHEKCFDLAYEECEIFGLKIQVVRNILIFHIRGEKYIDLTYQG